ncbi:hypothetical protein L6452_27528 [Arctium lappa]|uniref:Uncharacterized protein n=1 Tax=Arctium lappa TaxID=4217 RepID=A0ACB8ZVG8_ARCLA|nr:hypothetical protein L6452_27528 [Arctium lappa]
MEVGYDRWCWVGVGGGGMGGSSGGWVGGVGVGLGWWVTVGVGVVGGVGGSDGRWGRSMVVGLDEVGDVVGRVEICPPGHVIYPMGSIEGGIIAMIMRLGSDCELVVTLDRFIPNRSAMNFDFANYMLTGRKVEKESASPYSPWRESYQKQLAEIFNVNRTRILAFKNNPPTSQEGVKEIPPPSTTSKCTKRIRHISQVLEPVCIFGMHLKGPAVNFYRPMLIVAGLQVSNGHPMEHTLQLALTIPRFSCGILPPINWTLRGHGSRVGSLDWNNHILTTGSMDSLVINNDVRIRSHNIGTYRGHHQEVCGLKWSTSGQQLASGGNDNLLFIWDLSSNQRLHHFNEHTSAVKALSWCPFQSNLLVSGGGVGDQCVKFWNSSTGVCLNSVNTGSQVSCLLWNRHEREILSSHGFNDNQLILWKYPSMVKLAELHGHTSRVLHMSQSPNGYKVASLGADETLQFWNVFGTPEVTKNIKAEEPFASFARIR